MTEKWGIGQHISPGTGSLFREAYPQPREEVRKWELGLSVLANQFLAGLHPEVEYVSQPELASGKQSYKIFMKRVDSTV